MLNISEFRKLEVVNATTAERLGYVCDFEIDFQSGTIKSIIVPKRDGFFSIFRKHREYVIPWDNIAAIGKDIILVNAAPDFLMPHE